MVIQHNMQAIISNSNLNKHSTSFSKNATKLSSGYRINKAGDDAAGLTISEKMRSQIRGLDQAGENAQDAISLVQVAEGGMNEIHSILQRSRELAIMCANDTYTDADRTNVNLEIEALMKEVNKISDSTQFNTKKLLDGSLGANGGGGGIITTSYKQKLDGSNISSTLYDGQGIQFEYFDGTSNRTFTFKASNSWAPRDSKNGIIAAPGIDTTLAGIVNFLDALYAIPANRGGTLEAFMDEFSLSVEGASSDVLVAVPKNAGSRIIGITVLPGTSMAVTTPLETVTTGAAAGDGLNFQIGPNPNNAIQFSINSMDTTALGIQTISVASSAGASGAISAIDTAIDRVSSERSSAGAVQNRLESAIQNLSTYNENLTAAESRIRDTNMERELVDYSKNNILAQAAQSVLAQANQATQNVLQLLG